MRVAATFRRVFKRFLATRPASSQTFPIANEIPGGDWRSYSEEMASEYRCFDELERMYR